MEPFFAISDVVWQALIAALLAGFLEWIRRTTVRRVDDVKIVAEKAARKVDDVKIVAEKAARKVDDVKIVAEKAVEKVEEVKVVADQIHKLTDGNMSEQLKIGMIAAQTLANTKPTEANIQLSKTATDKYVAHLDSEEARLNQTQVNGKKV